MDNQSKEKPKEKRVGIQGKLLKALGDQKKVLESREHIDPLRDMAEKELMSIISQILEEPKATANWPYHIAMLIGTARSHRSYRDIFTIKEK